MKERVKYHHKQNQMQCFFPHEKVLSTDGLAKFILDIKIYFIEGQCGAQEP